MKICGIQKTTLLDYPGKLACTVFTGGCNFACPYCHNASLVVDGDDQEAMTNEAFFAFLEKRKGVLDGICITGGEPLIHEDLGDFIRRIKDQGFLVKLDTNGSFPDRMKRLVQAGLVDYVAMDIKHAPGRYGLAAGRESVNMDRIKASVNYLMTGPVDFEFRTTAVKGIHQVEDFEVIGQWIEGTDKYFIQNFENSGDIIAARTRENVEFQGFPPGDIQEILEKIRHHVPKAKARGI
jgi:pyruvate formate lyase activating enzyme